MTASGFREMREVVFSKNIPDICFYANMLRPVNKKEKEKFYYCETPDSTPKEKMDFLCPGRDRTPCTWQPSGQDEHQLCASQSERSNSECIKKIDPRRFCRNKDYVQITATAFHEMANCFELSSEDKQSVFALLSHESSFILNAHSQDADKARCYGAITGGAFKVMNRYIYVRGNNIKDSYHCDQGLVDKCCGTNKNVEECSKLTRFTEEEKKKCCKDIEAWERYSEVFKSFEEKCPDLSKKVFPQRIMTYRHKDNDYKKLEIKEIDEISIKDDKFNCALTHDPYTCMLYSMYYVKMNAKNFEDALPEISDPDEHISEKFKSLFQNKQIYKITVVQGTVKNRSEAQNITDDTEQISAIDYQTIKKSFYQKGCNKSSCPPVSGDCSADSNSSECFDDHCCHEYRYTLGKGEGQLDVKNVPLFSEKILRRFAIQTAHNYGGGFNKGILFKFLQFLKEKIADEKICTTDSKCNSYRKLLLKEESLTEDDLFYEFENFITETSNPESKDFAKKVRDNLKYLKNPDNKLKTNVENYVKNKDGNSLSDAEVKTFIEEVDKQCSEPLFLGSSQ